MMLYNLLLDHHITANTQCIIVSNCTPVMIVTVHIQVVYLKQARMEIKVWLIYHDNN